MVTSMQFTQADCDRFRTLVSERIGLHFPPDKQQMLVRGVTEALAASHCRTADEYYEMLRTSPSTDPEWDRLVSVLTIGETYFFRHRAHFDVLAQQVLPEIIAQRQNTTRRLRLWSAGCATGEEPYSIAMLLRDLLPNIATWSVLILATDINRAALQRAYEGAHGAWSFRGVEKSIQDRYFHLDEHKQYVISDEIKHMVTFRYLNLIEDPFPTLASNTQGMDVIFCRNVTIYFTADVTQQVLGKYYRCLVDGGWLIPGASEPNMVAYQDFHQRSFPGAVVFQKPRVGEAKPKMAPPLQAVVLPSARPEPRPIPPAPSPATPVAPAPRPMSAAPANARSQPSGVAPDPYREALVLLEAGCTDAAFDKLQEKLRQEPNSAPAYCALGKLFANRGNFEEAQTVCERAIVIDKLLVQAYYTLALIYQERGLPDKALEFLKKTVYLESGFILAHYNLAHLYRQMDNLPLARKALQNTQRLLTNFPDHALIPEGDGLVAGRLRQLVAGELAEQ